MEISKLETRISQRNSLERLKREEEINIARENSMALRSKYL